jgi:hypothetical protein
LVVFDVSRSFPIAEQNTTSHSFGTAFTCRSSRRDISQGGRATVRMLSEVCLAPEGSAPRPAPAPAGANVSRSCIEVQGCPPKPGPSSYARSSARHQCEQVRQVVLDPWLRAHLAVSARLLNVAEASMTITGGGRRLRDLDRTGAAGRRESSLADWRRCV